MARSAQRQSKSARASQPNALGRYRAEETGDAAAFLVSEKNSYMTGTTVEVCGFQRHI
jgi:NAD(P)-dependent dehydrogenase (short-subunit alcohol dehydrogenase family)